MLDKAFGAVNKARKADTVVFTLSRFEEYPDVWISDTSFKDMKKVSDLGKQVNSFVWGKSELIGASTPTESVRHPDQAGKLRSEQEISADGLHLRGVDARAPQLQPPERQHEHRHPPLCQQRLRAAETRHQLHDRLPR